MGESKVCSARLGGLRLMRIMRSKQQERRLTEQRAINSKVSADGIGLIAIAGTIEGEV